MSGGERAAPSARRVAATVLLAVLLSTAASLTLQALRLQDAAGTALLLAVVRFAASATFVTAGALRLARWRITGDARSAYLGACLLLLGGLSLPLFHLARALADDRADSLLAPATRLLTIGVCFVLIARALARGGDDSLLLHPARLVVRAAAVTAGLFLVVVAVWVASPALFRVGAGPPVVIEVVLVVGWLAVAVAALRRERVEPWAGRLAPLLASMGATEMLRLCDELEPGAWVPAAATLTAWIAVITAYCALMDLLEAAAAEHQRLAALSGALAVAHAAATHHDAWREELTHDLRNALTGLRAALHTLDAYEDRLEPAAAAQLRSAALDEVGHLEHLVEGADREEVVDFEVVPVVRTVAQTRRATGQDVRVHGAAGLVSGRPGDLTTVLQNLVVNAGVHAPGSPVTVELTAAQGYVEIAVSDRGPGIPAARAGRLFERGARGALSPGSGLGLYVARSLMRKHGGDVELRSHVGGATFVVLVPSVERSPAPEGAGPRAVPAS